MAHTRLRPSFTFSDDKLAELRRIAPEAFADGRVNWEVLKEALGEHADDESAEAEHFGLNWPGKREARRMAGSPSTGALVPKPGDGLNEDSTRNIFIEGENLEVLKLLQKAYRGKVKMIYIDPPYNTGNDFVYEDDFTEPLEEYLRRTGQVDEEGKALTTNTRADGRFHSRWLSMMYPRLRLARQLLRDDGVIFVSIDDNEVHHLRALMNEVFGEENFQGCLIWQHSIQPKGYTGKLSVHHNEILIYSRQSDYELGSLQRTEEHNKNYSNPDNDPNGKWRPGDVRNALYRKNLIYPIKTPSGKMIEPPKNGWRWMKETVAEKIRTGEIVFSPDETRIIRKIYLKNLEGRTPESVLLAKEVGSTRTASQELKELYGDSVPFDTPKPVSLLRKLIQIGTTDDDQDLVLDFFGGSGSTGQAVLEQNSEDKGDRQFILVQWPEAVNEANPAGRNAIELGLHSVSAIAQDRIRRAGKKLGIKVELGAYELCKSNYRAWKDYHGTDAQALEDLFAAQETPLREGWSVEGLTTEVMLLEGFPLDSRVEVQKAFKKNTVQRIHHEWHAHALFVCLDKQIHAETIAALVLGEGDTFICLDTAIDDQSKLRLSDKGMIKTI